MNLDTVRSFMSGDYHSFSRSRHGRNSAYTTNVSPTSCANLSPHSRFRAAIIAVNVLSYFNPLRELIRTGIREGFVAPRSESLIIFVDGPEDPAEHEDFDWGSATLDALDHWESSRSPDLLYDWTKRKAGDAAKGEEIEAA